MIESDEALILGEMVKHSRQVIAVADASKLGMVSAVRVCEPGQIHTIITDKNVPADLVTQFEKINVQMLCV